uniref:Uncharacterized protein n=1 Tax=Kalanchoe fedtschenkoi TaxID=63787 RepID=A0A7N0TBX3_KALFE
MEKRDGGRNEEADVACWTSNSCQCAAVLPADDLSHVCGASWRAGSLWSFHGHFFRFSHWLQLAGELLILTYSVYLIAKLLCYQMGMASALDTLCGQSYGAKQYHLLGIQMQKAMLILTTVSVPLAFIWANTSTILTTLGQDPEISHEAGLYAQYMIPSLFAYGLLQCLVRFLQTQNIVFPMMISSGVTTLLHILLCWVLVFKSGLGSKGAALANSISYCINVILLALYVKLSSSCSKTWTGFSVEALHNVYTFIRLAIPSALMVCLEMWSFEMMVLMSGLLPDPQLETSTLSISLNTAATVWMIPFGLSGAVSTRVSNELGAGRSHTARVAVRVVLLMVVAEGVIVGSVLILIRNAWGYAYSNDMEVVRYVSTMLLLVAVSHSIDGVQCVLSGSFSTWVCYS